MMLDYTRPVADVKQNYHNGPNHEISKPYFPPSVDILMEIISSFDFISFKASSVVLARIS